MINEFTLVAGLKLNVQKTKGMFIGPDRNNDEWVNGIHICNEPNKVLGIYIGHNKKECERLNWESKIVKLEKALNSWKHRDLTLFGKITIIKTMALSKLTFAASNCEIPNTLLSRINKILFEFLWGKHDKIKRSVLCNDIQNGGLKMVNITNFFHSLKAAWVHRFISNPHENWSVIGGTFLEHLGINFFCFKMNVTDETKFVPFKEIPHFYREVIIAFNKTKASSVPSKKHEILESVI